MRITIIPRRVIGSNANLQFVLLERSFDVGGEVLTRYSRVPFVNEQARAFHRRFADCAVAIDVFAYN